ncbi:MAG: hypothetical protein QY322_00920 [bacterium]|nr:MAG: hypothetical protein QY322_00920 [bacterium]
MTERFTISMYFQGTDRQVIASAVEKSNLPENVAIVGKKEYREAKKPFVVIAHAAYPDEATTIIKAGALDYVEMVNDADKLAQRLNS